MVGGWDVGCGGIFEVSHHTTTIWNGLQHSTTWPARTSVAYSLKFKFALYLFDSSRKNIRRSYENGPVEHERFRRFKCFVSGMMSLRCMVLGVMVKNEADFEYWIQVCGEVNMISNLGIAVNLLNRSHPTSDLGSERVTNTSSSTFTMLYSSVVKHYEILEGEDKHDINTFFHAYISGRHFRRSRNVCTRFWKQISAKFSPLKIQLGSYGRKADVLFGWSWRHRWQPDNL